MTRILDALIDANYRCIATPAPETLFQEEDYVEEHPPPVYRPFETPPPKEQYLRVDDIQDEKSLFKFFVDGSERLTKFADIIDPHNNYYPLYIAQTSVATTKLEGSSVRVEDFQMDNSIMLPDTFDQSDIERIRLIVQKAESMSKRKLGIDKVETYDVGGSEKPSDQARKAVLKHMHEKEIEVIESLACSGKVTRDSMLVIDGALEFYEKFQSESFRNVVGVSKWFDLNQPIGTGDKKIQAGTLVAGLPDKHRTPAISLKHRNLQIGTWYLRIRDAKYLRNPQDGVVKIELFSDKPTDSKQKLKSGRCDTISGHVLALRNVSTPLTDTRWASHLYPVYMTEQFAKAQFYKPEVLAALLGTSHR